MTLPKLLGEDGPFETLHKYTYKEILFSYTNILGSDEKGRAVRNIFFKWPLRNKRYFAFIYDFGWTNIWWVPRFEYGDTGVQFGWLTVGITFLWGDNNENLVFR